MKGAVSKLSQLFCFFMMPIVQASAIPIEYFSKQAQYTQLRLSPDGLHFAATIPQGNATNLAIINRATMKVIRLYGFGENTHIGKFYWANNERLVYLKAIKKGYSEQLLSNGTIFAANIDGSKRVKLFGYNMNNGKGGKSKNKKKQGLAAYGYIINMLPNDPEHILVRAQSYWSDYDKPQKIYKVNIYNKKRKTIAKTPLGNMKVVVSASGIPVVARGHDRDGDKLKYWYKDGKWQKFSDDDALNSYDLLRVNNEATKLYVSSALNGKTRALFEYDMASKKITKLFHHPTADIYSYIKEPGTGSIIGVKVMAQGIEYHYIDQTSPYSKLHQKLANAFAGHDISISANSLQDKEIIIYAQSDRNPGDFYLYNRKTAAAEFLLASHQWLDPNIMSDREFISFKSRDKVSIYGYLTQPTTAAPAQGYPLIVYVHGGPYGVQDSWHFDKKAQMFANNGYSVLQVNYRGSGGYGLAFEEVAYQKRATMIQQDIIDGTRWALNRDDISDDQVCIIGGSFGGYSAVMSPVLEPELFKCAVAFAGPYDLVYQRENADYMKVDSVSHRATEVYGENIADLIAQSPITHITKLKAPVLIVHGGRDRRVPPEHAFILKKALDKLNKPYQWLYKEKEGHGFYNEDNRKEYYQTSLDFIEANIKAD
jgi:dipeptidyl aminopeptidase/acylaminoacyl peptidase